MKKRVMSLVCAATMVISSLAVAPTTFAESETEGGGTLTASTLSLKLSKDPSDYKICIYWPAPDTYFEDNIQPGYQAVEDMYGVKFDYEIGTEWTQDVENQMVEAKAAQGYDKFMSYGADTSGANALYQELIDEGCTVVNYGGVMNDPQVAPVTVCGDVYDYSYNATKKMIEEMGGKGKIINVLENLGDVNTLERQKGVEAAVAEAPDVEICQTVGDINTEDQGYEKVSNALAANPDATGIIATGGTASRGLATAMDDYYKANPDAQHIFAVATDPSDQVMNGIKHGSIDIGIAQNGYGQGYIGGLVLLYLREGWTMKEFGKHIVTGYVFITTDNIDTFTDDVKNLSIQIANDLETKYLNAPE